MAIYRLFAFTQQGASVALDIFEKMGYKVFRVNPNNKITNEAHFGFFQVRPDTKSLTYSVRSYFKEWDALTEKKAYRVTLFISKNIHLLENHV